MIYSLLKNMSFDDEKGWILRNGMGVNNDGYTTSQIDGVAFGNGKYVTVVGGVSCISTDGLNWTLDKSVKNTSIGTNSLKLIYANSYFWGVYSKYIFRSSDGITWEQMFDSTNCLSGVSSLTFQYITYCFDKYIAIADNGYTAYSADGINWTANQSLNSTTWGTNQYYCNAFFTDTLYIGGALGKIAKTTDGITWTYVTAITGTPTIYNFNVYGTKVFAYCSLGKIFSSSNMTTWTSSTLLSGNVNWGTTNIQTFSKNGNIFVVTGSSGSKTAVSTNGGTSWTIYKNAALYYAMGTSTVTKIIFENGYFVAVGSLGKSARSTNGVNWTATTTISGISRYWTSSTAVNSIAYDGSTYMIVGDNSSYAISSDLKNWTFLDSLITGAYTTSTAVGVSSVWNIGVHNSKFIMSSGSPADVKRIGVDTNSAIARTDSSSQYKTWTYYSTLSSQYGASFAVNKHKSLNSQLIYCGRYLAYADDSDNTITTNTNIVDATDIVYENSKYTVTAAGGLIYNGESLASMTVSNSLKSSLFSTNRPNGIAYGNGKYVVVGPNGHTAYSTDAITWTYNDKIRNSAYWGTSIKINCVIYALNKFWIGGASGKCMSSDDGINWTTVSEVAEKGNSSTIIEIAFINSRLIFCLDGAKVVTYKP